MSYPSAHDRPGSGRRLTRFRCGPLLALQWTVATCFASSAFGQEGGATRLAEMSLEQLMDVQIVSVSRRAESLSRAAASIFVITQEDIRRSAATTLPEILRMAPNLQVARISSLQYAITARGFNNAIGNKLLVLIDGRAVYTPLFSGVFWEMQGLMIEDISRIEVISGPGATLWGANAVNGVINVITRNSADTQGVLLSADVGSNERGAAVRGGGTVGTVGTWRAYARVRDRDNNDNRAGDSTADSWQRHQIGFRSDFPSSGSAPGSEQMLTFQGDVLKAESEDRGPLLGTSEATEINLLARWSRSTGEDSGYRVRAYWSHSEREEPFLFSPTWDIFDVEFQHNFRLGNHRMIWGTGMRHGRDEVDPGVYTVFFPSERSMKWQNLFVQDEMSLGRNVRLMLGLKLEWNDYTGREFLPNARLAWDVAPDHILWAAWSRAVRAPSRFDRDTHLVFGPLTLIAGGPEFDSEVAIVSELGFRAHPSPRLNYSLTLFHHNWDGLRSGSSQTTPLTYVNGIDGESYGVEMWGNLQMSDTWRLSAGLTTLHKNLRFRTGISDTAGTNNPTLHSDPDYQWMLRSSWDLSETMAVDFHLRHVAELSQEAVPAYTELDLWWVWQVSDRMQLKLAARNLLDSQHPEFGAEESRSELKRNFLLGMKWSL